MRTKAIVIRKMQVGEYDEMVTVYSEDFGTMRCLARGIRRPTSLQSMHLELLNVFDFEVIEGRVSPIISSAVMLEQHANIKNSLPKLAAVLFFTEVLDKIAFENEQDEGLWQFLNAMLGEFNTAPASETLAQFRKHQDGFLDVLGYKPREELHNADLDYFFQDTIVGQKIASLSFLYQVVK